MSESNQKEHFTLTRFPNFAFAILIACALRGRRDVFEGC